MDLGTGVAIGVGVTGVSMSFANVLKRKMLPECAISFKVLNEFKVIIEGKQDKMIEDLAKIKSALGVNSGEIKIDKEKSNG
jgi:hypothetical protein